MAHSVEAFVEAELLIWARESMRLGTAAAAQRIGIDEGRLKEWEQGSARPTVAQLRKVAEVYKRPLAVFYLDVPPKDFDALKDFRRLQGADGDVWSPELTIAIRRAHARREVALELAEEIPDFRQTAQITEEVAVVAARIRDLLGIGPDARRSWRTDYDAYGAWRTALEEVGVLVFQMSGVDVTEARGFSIADPHFPVVAINSKESPRARTFSLLHETAHVLLRNGGLCDFHDPPARRPNDSDRKEVFCNAVAGEALVPTAELQAEIAALGSLSKWDDSEIRILAGVFRVSREVVLRRLLTLNLISKRFYGKKRAENLANLQSMAKPEGGPEYYRRVVANLGKPFIRLVLDALAEDRITASDASDFLEAKLNYLPEIEQAVYRG